MEKTLIELRNLLQKREKECKDEKKLTCVGLTAKKNLCIHKDVKKWRQAEKVETECRKRTAAWVRNAHHSSDDYLSSTCPYYEGFDNTNELLETREGHRVYTMEELRRSGGARTQCPYYTAREAIKEANVIVFNYLYLLDPQLSTDMIKKLARSKDSIVVFDEAHNIDDVCIEAYTLKLNNQLVGAAGHNITQLEGKLETLQ